MEKMILTGLQISSPRKINASGSGEWWDKSWETGFFKTPVEGSLWLGYEGLRGDAQADRKNHGGVDKAVCVYPTEHYSEWQQILERTDPLPNGSFGENFSTTGLLESEICIGDQFALGTDGVRLEVSQPRQPCWKLARRWRKKELSALVEQTGKTGFYFRVLHHGTVEAGGEFKLLEKPFPKWTIERCNQIMHHQKSDAETARNLVMNCPALSGSWKDALWRRAKHS